MNKKDDGFSSAKITTRSDTDNDKCNWEKYSRIAKSKLTEPFPDLLDENTLRMRRNLLVISLICFLYIFSGGIDPANSSVFGIKLIGLSNTAVSYILFIVLLYSLGHFIWACHSDFGRWRFRATGMKAPKTSSGSFPPTHQTHPGGHDQKQLTLNGWWFQNIGNFPDRASYASLVKSIEDVDQYVRTLDSSSINSVSQKQAQEIAPKFKKIEEKLDEIYALSAHISESLKKYDKGFYKLTGSDAWRWLILEWGLPVTFGGFTLVAMAQLIL